MSKPEQPEQPEQPELTYDGYLQLDALLNSQHPLSIDNGTPVHDEMFFILIHQAYELWFKSLLYELDRICTLLALRQTQPLSEVIWLFNRMTAIQQLLNQQLQLIETISPHDFLRFRDVLGKASGFQSLQFRLLECRLGILQYDKKEGAALLNCLSDAGKAAIKAASAKLSLFDAVNQWLNDFASTHIDSICFWPALQAAHKAFNPNTQSHALFNAATYTQSFDSQHRHLDYSACQAILFIMHYGEHPRVGMAYQLLRKILKVDDLLAKWRFGHALMVQRMLGSKSGTGGSSGYAYLKRTVDAQRVFVDIAHLTTYMIPADHLPPAESFLL